MSETTQQTTTTIPDYIKKPVQKGLNTLDSWIEGPSNYVYGSKPGETLFTGLSDQQLKSIGNVDWLSDQDLAGMFGMRDGENFLSMAAGTNADDISTERLVDEGGWLGAMGDYVNPYIQDVLDPQIREIEEATQRRLNDLGASAAMSGSFGDARHGINESLVYRDASEAISDATGRTYADAFDRAMGMRADDIGRQTALQENQRGRQMNAATIAPQIGQQFFDTFTGVNDMLYNAGEVQRDAEIERNEIQRSFQEAVNNKDYTDALKLIMAADGVPYETTSRSQTTERSNSGGWGLVGSLLGAFL